MIEAFNLNMIWAAAVSYTHLDVYKRQIQPYVGFIDFYNSCEFDMC